MKKLNIIANFSAPYSGNFIRSMLFLAEQLRNKYTIIFTFPESAKERIWIQLITKGGYSIFFYNSKSRLSIMKSIRLINSNNKVNVVYAHFMLEGLIKLATLFKRNTKLFIHVHSDFRGLKADSFFGKIKKCFLDSILLPKTKYLYVSKALYDEAKVKYKYYVPNVIFPTDKYFIESKNDLEVFEQVNKFKKDGSTCFLLYGWDPFIKGVDTAIKCFNDLKDIKAQLLIVCGQNNGIVVVEEFLNKNSIVYDKSKIKLINSVENTNKLYSLIDVFISASRSEGFSYSILEAIENKKDIIVSDINGTSWAKKYKTVLSFIPDNHLSLKDAVSFKLNNKTQLKTLEAMSKLAFDEFSCEKWINDILKIIY